MKTLTIIEGLNEEKLKAYLSDSLELLGIDCNFVAIDSIDESVYFDYIILNSSRKFNSMALNTRYCFVNMDNHFNDNINIFGNMITYGFGIKNTVTISSLQDDNLGFVYCLQRYLSLDGIRAIEPQEIPIHIQFSNDIHLYALVITITIGLIEEIDSETIRKNLVKNVLSLR